MSGAYICFTYPDRERNFLKNLCIGDRRANLNRLSKWAKGWRVSAVAEISCRTASHGAVVPEDEVILRYTQCLSSKWDTYQRYRETGTVGADDAFLIAVSGSKLHFPDDNVGPPWISKPLFGVGNLVLEVEIGTGNRRGTRWQQRPMRQNSRGAPIESDWFLSRKKAAVSAVLFSADHVKNRPETYGWVDGSDLRLFHNPFANIPLTEETIPLGEEWGVKDGFFQKLHDHKKKLTG